jgi:hypothetical protein
MRLPVCGPSGVFQMKKEYELVSDFEPNQLSSLFYALHVMCEQNNWDLLEIEACQIKVNDALRAIACKKRFDQLNEMSNTAIKYSADGFMLDNHKFETLDEVEKAYKLKAFL